MLPLWVNGSWLCNFCYCALNLITLIWKTSANVFVSAQHMVVSPICWLYQEVIKTALFLDRLEFSTLVLMCLIDSKILFKTNCDSIFFFLYFEYRPCWMSFNTHCFFHLSLPSGIEQKHKHSPKLGQSSALLYFPHQTSSDSLVFTWKATVNWLMQGTSGHQMNRCTLCKIYLKEQAAE